MGDKDVLIPMSRIVRDTKNHRRSFNVDEYKEDRELVESMNSLGLLQAIRVTTVPTEAGEFLYKIISGDRRWCSADHLKWKEIKAVVEEDAIDERVFKARIAENCARKDMSPWQTCQVIADYRDVIGIFEKQEKGIRASIIDKSKNKPVTRLKEISRAVGLEEQMIRKYIDINENLIDESHKILHDNNEAAHKLKLKTLLGAISRTGLKQVIFLAEELGVTIPDDIYHRLQTRHKTTSPEILNKEKEHVKNKIINRKKRTFKDPKNPNQTLLWETLKGKKGEVSGARITVTLVIPQEVAGSLPDPTGDFDADEEKIRETIMSIAKSQSFQAFDNFKNEVNEPEKTSEGADSRQETGNEENDSRSDITEKIGSESTEFSGVSPLESRPKMYSTEEVERDENTSSQTKIPEESLKKSQRIADNLHQKGFTVVANYQKFIYEAEQKFNAQGGSNTDLKIIGYRLTSTKGYRLICYDGKSIEPHILNADDLMKYGITSIQVNIDGNGVLTSGEDLLIDKIPNENKQ